jgi:hypothetical protein
MGKASSDSYAFFTGGVRLGGGGLRPRMSGRADSFNSFPLPAKNGTNIVCLPLAHDDLQCVTERDQPALAAERAHLADVGYIYDGVPVHSLKLGICHSLLDRPQALCSEKPLFRGDNPNQLPLRLERKNFVEVQQEVFFAISPNDLLAELRAGGLSRCNPVHFRRDFVRSAQQTLSAFDGGPQPRIADRFQQVIDCSRFKSFNGVLIKGGNDYDDGEVRAGEVPDDFKSAHHRHLKIKKNDVRLELSNFLQGFLAFASLTGHMDLWEKLQCLPQNTARDRLIINDQGMNHANVHPLDLS